MRQGMKVERMAQAGAHALPAPSTSVAAGASVLRPGPRPIRRAARPRVPASPPPARAGLRSFDSCVWPYADPIPNVGAEPEILVAT